MSKDALNVLTFESGDDWTLTHSDKPDSHSYKTEDLRMSVVYRARCFRDKAESTKFAGNGGPVSMTLDSILMKFASDMAAKGVVSDAEGAMKMDRLDFAMLIVKTYIKYPLPVDPLIPYNYCALDRILPALSPLLRLIC